MPDTPDGDDNFDPDFDWPDEPTPEDDEPADNDTNPDAPAIGSEEQ